MRPDVTAQPAAAFPQPILNLPNFLIIGANKAGTSAIQYYLSQHPDIFMSTPKEPMFFTSLKLEATSIAEAELNMERPYVSFSLDQYAELFQHAAEPLRGEASTSYLANPSCALWIRKILTGVKLIAVLRNPVERAFSNYKMHYQDGIEWRSFERAVGDEVAHGPGETWQGQHYLSLGLYGAQLSTFLRYFSPARIFVGDYDSFRDDSYEFMQRIFKFLGVSGFRPPDMSRVNVSEGPQHFPKALEAKVKKFFEEDNALLQTLVDFDVTHWI